MEEDADDLDNLFDEYDSNDRQPQENVNNENTDNDAAVPEKVPVPKRAVKHPRLKFNPERLCGKRGIPILVDHFKDVRFKSKGHEKENLKKLLTTLELWTHRLFPSMKFEDCLRQIEHLGKKRPVKTCLQKIRLDFPILDRDFVHSEEEEEQEQPNELEPEPPVQDAFDRLFDDYQERSEPILTSTPSSSHTVGNVSGNSLSANMNEEQKKRMEYNKMLAIERRKAKLSIMQSSSPANSVGPTNVETVFDSAPIERRNNIDPNFLFDYLQGQFTNIESSCAGKKIEKKCSQSMHSKAQQVSERDEMMESPNGDINKNDQDVLPNVRNNNCTEGNDKVELGLDNLMDLADEDNRDETVHDALSNICPDNNGKEELDLDELMDLVNEGDTNETDHDILYAEDNDKMDHNALSKARDDDYSETNSKKELNLNELMDLVEDDKQDTANAVVLPLENAVCDSDN